MIYLICGNAGCELRTVKSKLHSTLWVDSAGSDGHILLEVPPPPVGVHQNPQLEDQIDGEKGEEGQVVALLGPHSDTDPLHPSAQLYGAKDEADTEELEAECGDPPPVEGELEEEEEDEEAEEQTAPVRDTGEERGGGTQGLQLQVVPQHEDPHDLVTHAEIAVEDVQEPVPAGLIPAHEEEVEGEARHGDQQKGGGRDDGEDIPHILQQVFNDVPISYSGQC